MKIGATLRPGQKGTHALQAIYGDRLLCVRYRYDDAGRRRLKTAEIIVDEVPWEYCPPWDSPNARSVDVRVGYEEHELRERLKRARARWNPETRLWSLPLGKARRLGLATRIVGEASTSGNRGIHT